MRDIELKVNGARVTIDFTHANLSTETLLERAEEILPLLSSLIEADDACLKLTSGDLANRLRGCLAMNMMCQHATQKAIEQAILLRKIADGSEAIADHGFPEFSDGQSLDV
jgi:hypothetical protein